jgi:dihydroorotase
MPTQTPLNSHLIRAARVIDPASGMDRIVDVGISGGSIKAIDSDLGPAGYDNLIQAEGMILTPGLIDPHVHLREPGQTHKEDIESGTLAAISGGFTTVCCMPNTSPALDTPDMVKFIDDRAREKGHCRVFSVACGTIGRKGTTIAPISEMHAAGAVGFSDDGDVIEDPSMMSDVFRAVHSTGTAFMQHCQDPKMTVGAVMNEGEVSRKLGLTGWPRIAEESIIERDIELTRPVGCRYHIQHISSGGSIPIIAQAQSEGVQVTAEASPHHLLLTDSAIESLGSMAKMNPPLREQADCDALAQAVADGIITILATDHAPHSADEKANPIEQAPFGIIGLESAFGLYHRALVETGLIDWTKLIELMTINPARLCNLDQYGLGKLSVGGPADITLIDPDHKWTLSPSDLVGKSTNTPFLEWTMNARPMMTVVNGTIQHSRLMEHR